MASSISTFSFTPRLETRLCSSFSCSSVTHIPSPRGCSKTMLLVTRPAWVASECHNARFPPRIGKVVTGSRVIQVTKARNFLKLARSRCQAVSFNLHKTASQEVCESQFLEADDSQETVNSVSSDQIWFSIDKVELEERQVNSPVALKADDGDQTRSRSHFQSFKIWFSDVVARKKSAYLFRDWSFVDMKAAAGMSIIYSLCLCAPFNFSWNSLAVGFVLLVLNGFGMTLSYHRNLSHRSFKLPKWLEYFFAYCGAHGLQGDPMFWVSAHRYHHKDTDGEKDPHSPRHGVWHSYVGWFLDRKLLTEKVAVFDNIPDMINDPFYIFLNKTYPLHPIMLGLLLYKLGGIPYVAWGMGVRGVWSYSIGALVASVGHLWGERKYKTNDLSRNNWWISLFGFGEGWHNTHHAFPNSAQNGFDWWEIDQTWALISFLEKVGLATEVKRPTEEARARLALK